MASQHGDTVIGATIGNGKFSYNTSKGTMSSSLNPGNSNQITAGENLITSMDDLMSKTDSIAEANRQRAMDEKKNALLKQKGGYTDEEISNMSPEEKATKLHDVGLNEQARGVIDEGQNTSRDEDEGFLSRTLNEMKDDLVGAIGVTSDKDGFTDSEGNYHQRTCFVAGTLVRTKTGFVEIEKIKVGDEVMSLNEKTGEISSRRVTETFIHDVKLLYRLTYENGTVVETTWNHPEKDRSVTMSSVKNSQRKPALVLASINSANNENISWAEEIKGTLGIAKIEQIHRADKVYNIEVEDDHTYFVTKGEMLVHNYPGEKIVNKAVEWGKETAKDLARGGRNAIGYIMDEGYIERSSDEMESDLQKAKKTKDSKGRSAASLKSEISDEDSKYQLRENSNIKNYGNTGPFHQYGDRALLEMVDEMADDLPKGQKLYINDISLPGGVQTKWHLGEAHRKTGLGIDVKMPTKNNTPPNSGSTYRSKDYDFNKTVNLIDSAAKNTPRGHDLIVNFNDPKIKKQYKGTNIEIRPDKPNKPIVHDNHLHFELVKQKPKK
ncbi:MAG: hypothetical protein HUU45_13160 [Leptospiraceae bacterium]|nr:hypothetical protein [Leptospiraceae bacterium]